MNVIQKAIDDARRIIPRAILETVFTRKSNSWRASSISIEECIRFDVVMPRVFIDCNLVGGHEVYIPLDGLQPDYPDEVTTVFRIPKERTNGRTIVSLLNVSFIDPSNALASTVTSNCGVSAPGMATQSLMESYAPMPIVSSATLRMMGENVFMIRDVTRLPANSHLRCVVTHDDAMSHIHPRSYHAFCKLVEYAVKSHVYNEYNLELDNGEIRGGHNLGRFAQTIDKYEDAEELYQTYLKEKWEKISRMNDREFMQRHIRSMVTGR